MSELLKINVNDHVEKKNKLSYLSWAWAWAEVLKIDPAADWSLVEYPAADGTLLPYMLLGNGTAMVKVRVTINERTRSCLLPVMNHMNKAIQDPDTFAVNTAMMRCLAKAISMHGLGLYIYAGEDLPEAPNRDDQIRAAAEAAIVKFNAGNEYGAYEEVCSITDNEEMLLLWGYLGKENSALRAAIKRLAAEERARQKAVEAMPSAVEARKAA